MTWGVKFHPERFFTVNSCVLDLLDLFLCHSEERGVNLVIFVKQGGKYWNKMYLQGVLIALNVRMGGGVVFEPMYIHRSGMELE